MASHYQKAYFLLSAENITQLPQDKGIEVAIVGRSNAGKSTLLNSLSHNKQLARVSKTPGRTQQINVFMLDENRRMMDLPGYGYAQVPIAVKKKWEKTVNAYFKARHSLAGLILVMDIRHPLKSLDILLLEYCAARGLALHIVLTKADKINKSNRLKMLNQVSEFSKKFSCTFTIQTFSAITAEGLKTLQLTLDKWYHYR